MNTTAIKAAERINFRREKAMAFTSIIMEEIDDLLPGDVQSLVFDRIFTVMSNNGAAWTTDHERALFGMEPRDNLGWTSSERVANERMRHEAMISLQPLIIENTRLK
jgi:hypothetical protein